MRVILDTNVLMSGIFFGGVPGRLLDAWAEGRFRLVVSPRILEEYRRVGAELATRYPARAEAVSPVLALVTMHATLVEAPPLAAPVSVDPDNAAGEAICLGLRDVDFMETRWPRQAPPQKRWPLCGWPPRS